MKGYLGEFSVDLAETPFAMFGSSDWALYFIAHYGGLDGAHHKLWVLDQVARILNGCWINVVEARWADGTKEYRVTTGEAPQYHAWASEVGWEAEGKAP